MDESGWILFSLNVNSQNSASFFLSSSGLDAFHILHT